MSKTKKYEVLTILKKSIYKIPGKIYNAFIPFMHKRRWNHVIADSNYSGISGNGNDNPSLIVSLTSFPARIKYVHIPIESMLMQTVKPDMVILWLADSQFPNREEDLSDELLKLRKYGLTIDWCDDIRSYKKLVPTLEKYPDATVVTIDDDLYYSPRLIEKLLNSAKENNGAVCCHRAHRIEKSEHMSRPFVRKDIWSPYPHPSFLNQLTGGAGTYFPAHSLYQDVTNRSLFMKLASTNDDIWFWAMAVLAGYRCLVVKNSEKFLYPVEDSQQEGLALNHFNNRGTMPVYEQMMNIINYYPQLKEILNDEWDKEQKGGFA